MKSCIMIAIGVASSLSVAASALDLEKGVVKTEDNTFELTQTTTPDAYAYGTAMLTHRKLGDRGVVSFFIQNDVNRVISLSRGMKVYVTDLENDKILSVWPLTRWPHDTYFPEELAERYVDHGYSSDFGDDRPFHLELGRGTLLRMGCLADTPLRYGDINNDGNSELVVWIGNDFVVFSTVKNKVLFSQRLRVEDWLDKNESEEFLSLRFGNLEPHFPQYQSAVLRQTTANYQSAALGYRGYGKLYMADFNEDGHHDIVVWHKFYISNTLGDSTLGFSHERDTLLHYSLIDGEYQPQETDGDTIRGWLA